MAGVPVCLSTQALSIQGTWAQKLTVSTALLCLGFVFFFLVLVSLPPIHDGEEIEVLEKQPSANGR